MNKDIPWAERQKRARLVLGALKKRYPEPVVLLNHADVWELLVATVLAAQCTDARVNLVTPEFFKRWPGPAELAQARQSEIEDVIRSTGFFRNKARNLLGAAKVVHGQYAGQVPRTLKELIRIPGVARKTANVVLWGGFGINEGLAVDTHVKRIAYRLGLTDNTDPNRVEQDLLLVFPQQDWGNVNHYMVWFGRQVCQARNPHCAECEMSGFCPRNGAE